MITAVDTNVLLDLFANDRKCADRSAQLLRQCLHEGCVVACDVVWAETAAAFGDESAFRDAMAVLGVGFSPPNAETAQTAGQAWRRYRSRGGTRQILLADFLIAAHARCQCDRLLSRDRGFYREYFAGLAVLDPADA